MDPYLCKCPCQSGKCKAHLCLAHQQAILRQCCPAAIDNRLKPTTTPIADCNGRFLNPNNKCSFPWSKYLMEQWICSCGNNSCGMKHIGSSAKNLPSFFKNRPTQSCSEDERLFGDSRQSGQQTSGKSAISNDIIDEAFRVIKEQRLPIIWIFGHAHKPAEQIRQQFCKELASSMGFLYLNMDNEIGRWSDQLFRSASTEEVLLLPPAVKRLATMCVQLMGDEELHLNLPGVMELIKLVMINSWNEATTKKGEIPRGFIIEDFPCTKREAEAFEKTFYPMSLGLYFEGKWWSDVDQKCLDPEVHCPTYFRRDKPYCETYVEEVVDSWSGKSIKILNMEDFTGFEASYLIKVIKEKLTGAAPNMGMEGGGFGGTPMVIKCPMERPRAARPPQQVEKEKKELLAIADSSPEEKSTLSTASQTEGAISFLPDPDSSPENEINTSSTPITSTPSSGSDNGSKKKTGSKNKKGEDGAASPKKGKVKDKKRKAPDSSTSPSKSEETLGEKKKKGKSKSKSKSPTAEPSTTSDTSPKKKGKKGTKSKDSPSPTPSSPEDVPKKKGKGAKSKSPSPVKSTTENAPSKKKGKETKSKSPSPVKSSAPTDGTTKKKDKGGKSKTKLPLEASPDGKTTSKKKGKGAKSKPNQSNLEDPNAKKKGKKAKSPSPPPPTAMSSADKEADKNGSKQKDTPEKNENGPANDAQQESQEKPKESDSPSPQSTPTEEEELQKDRKQLTETRESSGSGSGSSVRSASQQRSYRQSAEDGDIDDLLVD